MAEIGGLLFAGFFFLVGIIIFFLVLYFFMKSRERERELDRKMKEGPKDNV